MKHKIIKTDNYLLVVDDSEIKINNTVYVYCSEIEVEEIRTVYGYYNEQFLFNDKSQIHIDYCKKIIAHLPLNGYAILKDVPLLPPLEVDDDIEELAEQKYSEQSKSYEDDLNDPFYNYPKYLKIGFVDGYNKAKESERNNLTPFKNLIALIENGLLKGTIETNLMIDQEINICKEYLNKQSQPKTPTHFEVEMGTKYFEDSRWETHPILVTNQQGQTQLVGRYIYE